jgi:hypothetical protein
MVAPVTSDHHFHREEQVPGLQHLGGRSYPEALADWEEFRQRDSRRGHPGPGNWPDALKQAELMRHSYSRVPGMEEQCFQNRMRDQARFWTRGLRSSVGVAPLPDHPLHSEGATETSQDWQDRPIAERGEMQG